ncbi:hypothetical protein ACFQO4_18345 [Saliphagus sp. GCM10025334]
MVVTVDLAACTIVNTSNRITGCTLLTMVQTERVVTGSTLFMVGSTDSLATIFAFRHVLLTEFLSTFGTGLRMVETVVDATLSTADCVLRTEWLVTVITRDDIVLANGYFVVCADNRVFLADILVTDGTCLEMRVTMDLSIDATGGVVIGTKGYITRPTELPIIFTDRLPAAVTIGDVAGCIMVRTHPTLLDMVEAARFVRIDCHSPMRRTEPTVADDTVFEVIGANGVSLMITGRRVRATDEFLTVNAFVACFSTIDVPTLRTHTLIHWTECLVVVRAGRCV